MAPRSLIIGKKLSRKYLRNLVAEIEADPFGLQRELNLRFSKTICHRSDTQEVRELHAQWKSGKIKARSFAAVLRDFCATHMREDHSLYVPDKLRKLLDQWESLKGDNVGPAYKR